MFLNIFIDKVNHMTNPFFESIFYTDANSNTVLDVLRGLSICCLKRLDRSNVALVLPPC